MKTSQRPEKGNLLHNLVRSNPFNSKIVNAKSKEQFQRTQVNLLCP